MNNKWEVRLARLNIPYTVQAESKLDGSVQIYCYDKKQATLNLSLEKSYYKNEYNIKTDLSERVLKLAIAIRRTSEHWFELVIMNTTSTDFVSAKGYDGVNNELNRVYALYEPKR